MNGEKSTSIEPQFVKSSTIESLKEARRKFKKSIEENSRIRQDSKKSGIHNLSKKRNEISEKDSGQPPGWVSFLPTYQTFARFIAIVLIGEFFLVKKICTKIKNVKSTGVLLYITAYAIIGKSAAPGSPLFSLITLSIGANFGGFLFGLTTLPRLIGMLFTGILFQVSSIPSV